MPIGAAKSKGVHKSQQRQGPAAPSGATNRRARVRGGQVRLMAVASEQPLMQKGAEGAAGNMGKLRGRDEVQGR